MIQVSSRTHSKLIPVRPLSVAFQISFELFLKSTFFLIDFHSCYNFILRHQIAYNSNDMKPIHYFIHIELLLVFYFTQLH
jgi:hypothetical protein